MSRTIASERRMLTEAEFEAVLRSHYPEICGLPKEELVGVSRRAREYRDKARDITRHRRRERRGKAEPRGAIPAPSEAVTSMKKQIFTSALKRVKREIKRVEEDERRPTLVESASRALELKRANRVRHHPSAGRTASHGMRPLPNEGDTARVDPREIGCVSQAVRAARARRDR